MILFNQVFKLMSFLNDVFNFFFQKVALHIAVENGNFEIVKHLLSRNDIDLNIIQILIFDF